MWTSCHVNVKTLFFFFKKFIPNEKRFPRTFEPGTFLWTYDSNTLTKTENLFPCNSFWFKPEYLTGLYENIWKCSETSRIQAWRRFSFFLLFEILHVYYIPLCLGKYYFPKFIGKQEICLLLLKKTSFFWFYMFIISP